LVVDLVPDPHELVPTGLAAQRRDLLGDGRREEVDPTHDPGDESCLRGDRKELPCLVHARAGLDEHRALDAAGSKVGSEVLRPKRPANGGELIRHPRVVGPARVPEMVMGIDDQTHREAAGSGTGASGGSSPSDRSSAQSSSGIVALISSGYSSRCSIRRTPATIETTAGWARTNCTAAAFSGTPCRSQTARNRWARSTSAGSA